MPKERMVTRTCHVTYATILVVNLAEEKTEQVVFELPGIYKDDKAIIKAAEKRADDNTKIVHVIETEVQDKLKGMSEDDFFANAIELPARTKATSND